ncbi:MAG: NYN domain-containing protein [Pirellulales bacterium]
MRFRNHRQAGLLPTGNVSESTTCVMRLLIDGYNLIHAAGIVGPRSRDGRGLERSRTALARFVSELVGGLEKASAVIVFDAAGAPPGLPSEMFVHGVNLRFARGYNSADELIEELIQLDTAPRRLTVVSSDHRIQCAARRRKARAVDSDTWYDEALQLRARRERDDATGPQAPTMPDGKRRMESNMPQPATLDDEIRFWLDRILEDKETDPANPETTAVDDIFPPGYAEDVFEEEDGK